MARRLVRRRPRPSAPDLITPVEDESVPAAAQPPASVRSVVRPARPRGSSLSAPGRSSAEVLYLWPSSEGEDGAEVELIERRRPRFTQPIEADYLDYRRDPA